MSPRAGEAPPGEGSVAVPGPPGAFAEGGLHYQFRSDSNGGQVTYRVVQVSEAPLDGPEGAAVSVVSTFAPGTPQVLQNPFSNGGGSPGSEGGAEARLTWAGEGALLQADPALAQAGGSWRCRRVPRDERRRAQHNEVERRRRDKINNWIVQLSKIIPDCGADGGKSGASKGGILSKACDYVRELRQSNQRLQETFKEAERLQMDNDLLRQQVEELKSENAALRAQLQQRGLDGTPEATPP
ncbi:upstream stimulatory factor 2 [Haemorhous mexicanus]|uniref:upstream stimulatory factor 2 n=1 Tax=Haemorhous mexicanus TaxID=30427 RepID=UPI0028BD2C99|nr:upstream stimulatory factor 2 [Haemorhous mexicanus]